MIDKALFGGVFEFTCIGKDGQVKWRDTARNLVVNEGLDHILDVLFKDGTQIITWYIGLTDGAPTVAAEDTLDSHAGWVEVTNYTGDRKAFVSGAVSDQSLDNQANDAEFTLDANSVVMGGAFLASTTDNTGILLCAAAFDAGNKEADTGDKLEVRYTFSAGDAG